MQNEDNTAASSATQPTPLNSDSKRVLLVVNTLPPHDLSGAGEQVVQLGQGLRELGLKVEILGRGEGGAPGPKVLFPVTVVFPALQRLWRGGFDVVQIHESDGGMLALAIRLLRLPLLRRWAPRVKLVALLQVTYDEEARAVRRLVDPDLGVIATPVVSEKRFLRFRTPVQKLLGRLSARYADVVLVPSGQTAREVQRDYGAANPLVLPNATTRSNAVLERKPDPGRLLFVGRLRIRKGVEVLLHAIAQLRRAGTECRLTIAGDGERREVLEKLTEELSLASSVDFLGHCDASTIRHLLAKSEALVVPSTYEGMPLVILEAMDASVPVVASSVSGIPEVVVNGETGWLVEAEQITQLKSALESVMRDAIERDRRGAAGRARVELFRPPVVAAIWCEHVFNGARYPSEHSRETRTSDIDAIEASKGESSR